MQDNGASDQSAVCERGRSIEHRKRFRAEIILLRLQGVKIADVATRLNTSLRTVSSCLTASKLMAPSRIASSAAAATSVSGKTSISG